MEESLGIADNQVTERRDLFCGEGSPLEQELMGLMLEEKKQRIESAANPKDILSSYF